ncbi:MAG: dockerin type I repeat-containing protein [Candidatus Howiella sp.]|jgi:hypothetical protein
MKKRWIVLCAGITAALLFSTAATAITQTGLAQYLTEQGVSAYYIGLLEEMDSLYHFSDPQYGAMQSELEEIIAIAKQKNPGLLSSPNKFSGCGEAEYQSLKAHFSALCDTAGFTLTETRNAGGDGRILSIVNAADNRLLLEVRVADNELSGVLPGDLDGDGRVTVSDVVALRLTIVWGNADDYARTAGDLDSDGKLTVSDVVALRAHIVNL